MNTQFNNVFKSNWVSYSESNNHLRDVILAKGDVYLSDAFALPLLHACKFMPKSLVNELVFSKKANAIFGFDFDFKAGSPFEIKEVQIALDKAREEIGVPMWHLSSKSFIESVRTVIEKLPQTGNSFSALSAIHNILNRLNNTSLKGGGIIGCDDLDEAINLADSSDDYCRNLIHSLEKVPEDTQNEEWSVKLLEKNYPSCIPTRDFIARSCSKMKELVNQSCLIACAKSVDEGVLTSTLNTTAKATSNQPAQKKLIQLTPSLLLAAILGSHKVLKSLARGFGLNVCEIKFPQHICSERVELMEHMTTKSFESYENGQRKETHWIAKAEEQKKLLELTKQCEYFLGLLSDIHVGKITHEKLQAYACSENWEYIGEEFGRFIQSNVANKRSRIQKLSSVQAIKYDLNSQVLGQPQAVESLTSVISNMLFKPTDTHLGVSTFLGSSGVGKTFLADKLADSINQSLSLGYQCKVINMEQYIEEKDVLKLWGSGSQYVNTEFGELTATVAKYPKQVFVFDEIEKAHPAVVQSLLTLIDKGKAKDRTTEREGDFSQCLFIFTTNLGAKTIEQLSDLDVELDIKDLLTSSGQKNPLSSEMVNRLNAGNIVLFKKLKPRELIQLATQASNDFMQRSAIDWRENLLPTLMLDTLGGDISPRSINTQAEKLEANIESKAMSSLSQQDFHKLENIMVRSEFEPSNTDLNVVLFTNNKKLCEYVSRLGVKCLPAKDISKVKAVLDSKADCFIFDEKSITLDPKELSIMLQKAQQDMPENLLYLMTSCAEKPLNRLNKTQKLFQRIFSVPKRTGAIVTDELAIIACDVQLVKNIDERIKRNLKADYTIAVNETENGIDVFFKDFSHKPALSQNDLLPFLTFDGAPEVSFEDVYGLEAAKQDLKLVINAMNQSDYLIKRNTSIAKGCIFSGHPGTGKTMLAKALAAECGISFFNVNSADLISGDIVKNINDLFDIVEKNAPAILFFDEIDAIAQCRSKGSEFTRVAVNTLLVRLDGFNSTQLPVFVVAATNHPSLLDAALMRSGRLEKRIYCDLPSSEVRKDFISKYLNKSNCHVDEQQIDEITKMTGGCSIAVLTRIIRESFYTEIKTQIPWSFDSLIEEIRTAKFGDIRTDMTQAKEDIKATAYHEAGHLVAHKLLFPGAKVELASVQPRGAALGMVVPGESNYTGSVTKQHIKDQLQVLLAGLATERLQGFVGDKSLSGASDDRSKATTLAKRAIVDWGMSDEFGLAIPSQLTTMPNDISSEVNNWLSEAFDCVTKLLKKNKNLLATVAEMLTEQETLNSTEIDELFVGGNAFDELKVAS
jgi:cell division protease FtsH